MDGPKTPLEALKPKRALKMLSIGSALEMLKAGNVSPGWLAPLKLLGTKTALGMDISDKQINLALVKKGKNGPELLKYASAPVPGGAIENGDIKNAAALANAIKELKNSNKIRTTQTAVSLFTKPVIVQIMGVPKQIPSNIGQFIQEQVRHFAVLPGNKIAFDFCGVGRSASDKNFASRLLVTAADERKVADIVSVCNQAGLVVEAIEPSVLAYTRALYASRIAGKFDCNVLVAILQEEVLTLCVFRKQTIDFVRTKNIDKEKTEPAELCQWLAEQINTVVQFYDVENPDSSGKWETVVVADNAQLPKNLEESLKAKVTSTDLQLLANEDVCNAAVVGQAGEPVAGQQTDKASPIAIGLAMKLLGTETHKLGVNLLPQDVVRLRTTQRGILVTANIIAALFLIMALATSWPNWQVKKIYENIDRKKTHLSGDAHTLVREHEMLNKQIKNVSNKLEQIEGILGSHRDTDWPGLLNDIAEKIPRIARITSLSGVTNSGMTLKGLALSNEAVYLFADMLKSSEHIMSATIAETSTNNKGFINYEIRCALAQEEKNENAD